MQRSPAPLPSVAVQDLDLELLAAKAVVDADARSTGSGGRFSIMDVRAGALRAIAATGVVADRDELAKLAEEVVAHSHTVTLISEPDAPKHVKHLMAVSTATLKATLAQKVDAFSAPGQILDTEEVAAIGRAIEPDRTLDDGQLAGAAAIGGTSRNVVISGPAGTGKTTMLKVAGAALRRRGHNMIIVAPTKKASAVAGRETMSSSSSLHQLLHDYGWRWATAASGATEWRRLSIGESGPDIGRHLSRPPDQHQPWGSHRRRRGRHAGPRGRVRASRRRARHRRGSRSRRRPATSPASRALGRHGALLAPLTRSRRAHDYPPLQGSSVGGPHASAPRPDRPGRACARSPTTSSEQIMS